MRQHTRGPAPTPVRANHKHVARTHKKVRRAVVTSSDLEALLLSLPADQATVMHRDGDRWVAETKAGTEAELDLWMEFVGRYRARQVRQTRKAALPAAPRRARVRSRERRERRHVARATSSTDGGEPEPPLPAISFDPPSDAPARWRWVSGVAA